MKLIERNYIKKNTKKRSCYTMTSNILLTSVHNDAQ